MTTLGLSFFVDTELAKWIWPLARFREVLCVELTLLWIASGPAKPCLAILIYKDYLGVCPWLVFMALRAFTEFKFTDDALTLMFFVDFRVRSPKANLSEETTLLSTGVCLPELGF